MSHTEHAEQSMSASHKTLIRILETLPGALFFVDDTNKIIYANTSAQTLIGTTLEALRGKPWWSCAPQLVSMPLYQALQRTWQSREQTEVSYVSPLTQTWLHVSLSPIEEGLTLHFHEGEKSTPQQEPYSPKDLLPFDALNGLYAGIGLLTPDGIIVEINEIPLENTHLYREEVIGKHLAEIPWWSPSSAGQGQVHTAIAQTRKGETVRFETLIHSRQGLILNLEAAITPHVNAQRHIEYLIFTGIDITARKRAETDIRELLDAIPQFIWTGRPDGYVEYYSQSWRDYTGLTDQQSQGNGWLHATHPDDRQRVLKEWRKATQTGELYETELRLRQNATGSYYWFLVRAVPHKDAQGNILKWFGTCTDIHEKKQAEEDVHALVDAIPQLVWIQRPDGFSEYCNQRWCDYCGMTAEQARGKGWQACVHPDDRKYIQAIWQHAVQTDATFEAEQRMRNGATGAYRWFLVRAMPHKDAQGNTIKWFGTCTDIDEQKHIEEALRQSQEHVQALLNSPIIGIFLSQGDTFVEANDTFLQMTGYTREDLLQGRISLAQMTPPEYAEVTRHAHEELVLRQSMTPYEKEYLCQDGSRLPVVEGGVIAQSQPLQCLYFVLDNSARKELEQRKDDFIRMASHELKTPLTALKLQTQLLGRQLAKQNELDSMPALARMELQINKVARLMGELLDVSKIQEGKLEYRQETVDLDALLRETADTMQNLNPSHKIFVRSTGQASLIGDRDRLGQVFINLLNNAIKYSPAAERVEIDLSASPETITVRIHDYGLGIPREQHDKIFERFYRVSDPQQKAIPGLGMGLFIVAEIVHRHGGTVTVESTVGKGSTFQVTLPRQCANC